MPRRSYGGLTPLISEDNTLIQSGTKVIGSPFPTNGTITFPRAFASAPTVTLTALDSGENLFLRLGSVTLTGFTWYGVSDAGSAASPMEVHWHAIGDGA